MFIDIFIFLNYINETLSLTQQIFNSICNSLILFFFNHFLEANEQ